MVHNVFTRTRELVNGSTVRRAYRERDMIYNILTETYMLVYVNNMRCETLNPDDDMVKKYI